MELQSVSQFSHSVVSDSLQLQESQHARPPCPSPPPRVHSNSCPSSHPVMHPAILSSVIPFSCPQSLPASGSFPMSLGNSRDSTLPMRWPKYWSLSFSISPSNEPLRLISFRMDWTGWMSLQSKGLSRVFSNTTVQRYHFFSTQLSSQSNSHIHT